MRLQIIKSKNAESFYVVKSVYINKKRTNKVFEKLGTLEEVKQKAEDEDPYVWAKMYVEKLTNLEKENKLEIIIKKQPSNLIPKNEQTTFNGGYIFLEKIYYELGLNKICETINNKYKIEYDLNNILSRLIFSRILFPGSKHATLELSKKFLEQPNFDLHQIYRALDIINKEIDFIQSEVYKNSLKVVERNSKILYYDCTNYFFEIEEEKGLKKYGKSKENRPNPIVQMGLFLDGNGLPLAFNITSGNTNEQTTLKPLEEKIINDFETSEFIVCTDAGLSSAANRKFNNLGGRSFITTQSVKKLKTFLKEQALDLTTGWKLPGSEEVYSISNLRTDVNLIEASKEKIFYKEIRIKENDLEQRLIVTYSSKYQEYQKKIRNKQIERAMKLIQSNPKKIAKPKQNDFKRLIAQKQMTTEGELAEITQYSINQSIIEEESKYDGIYAVCTNLEDDVSEIINVNKRRWEIEESFRIMKTEFKSRPVYLQRDERIQAHFTTCYLSLLIYRILEKKLNEQFTCSQIISTLKDMNFFEITGDGYVPTYIRNNITDSLHDTFGFRTDYEIVENKKIKKIFKWIQK